MLELRAGAQENPVLDDSVMEEIPPNCCEVGNWRDPRLDS